MNILHLANFNSSNIGNGALILGTERILKEDFGHPVNFVSEPWDDYSVLGNRRFDDGFVQMVNHKSDGLLVGAAVTMNSRSDFKNAGMRFDLSLRLWPEIAKPVAFYGLSYRMWSHQRYHNADQFRRAMDYILTTPRMLFSVRNDGTKAWIESLLGYSSDNIVAIPDPALYVPVRDTKHPEIAEGRVNIAISLNSEDEIYRFGGASRELAWKYLSPWLSEQRLLRAWRSTPGWENTKKRFLRNLACALERVTKEWDVNFILCPHWFDDFKMISEFISLCPRRIAYQLAVSAGVLKVSQTAYFYDLYAKVDAALSMRIHSMSPAIGLGTPTVALVSQSRMSEFLKDAGLPDFGIDIFDPDFADKLHRRLSQILRNGMEVRRRLQSAVFSLRERSRAFNQRVASHYSKGM